MRLPVWSWKGLRVLGDQPGKKSVQIHILQRGGQTRQWVGGVGGGRLGEEKDWFAPALAAPPLRPVKITIHWGFL